MRKHFYLAAAIALGVSLAAISVPSQAQMMGGYGGYGMMGGYGGNGGGYGSGYMMGPGYGGNYGPGMMYGYGPDGQRYYGGHSNSRRGEAYRGKRLCWHQTGSDQSTGYYGKCPN
jgi:hypothetical protein